MSQTDTSLHGRADADADTEPEEQEQEQEQDREQTENRGRDQGGEQAPYGAADTRTETDERSGSHTRASTTATQDSCPECGGRVTTDERRGETVCTDCQLVVDDTEIDHGPEWRTFDDDDKTASRVGAPMTQTLHDKGLTTKIGWQNKDARGNTVSTRKRKQLSRLRTWDKRCKTRDAADRNLRQALSEIGRMASALGLPRAVEETAGTVYRRALSDGLLIGRSIEGIATAALYAAARQHSQPRSLDEFESISRVSRKRYSRAYRYLASELSLRIEPTAPHEFLDRFASGAGLDQPIVTEAADLLDAYIDAGRHSGQSPTGLAAAALYAATQLTSDVQVTQDTLSEAADVSDVTIRNHYRDILDASGYNCE